MARMKIGSGVVRQVWAPLVALLLAAGCGGGSDAPVAQGSAFTQGTITGFGSVIVNGVRFDDSAAQVVDDEDQPSSRDALRLGMSVEIESGHLRAPGAGSSTRAADARHIRFGSEIVGPVETDTPAVNGTPRTLVVLNQTVEITDTTVFDDSLNGNLQGQVLEIHAQFDTTTGHYVAKRIEPKPDSKYFKLRGVVSELTITTTPPIHTFKIGDATINFTNVAAADLPNNFANGVKVRVRLEKDKDADGNWVAVSIRLGVRKVEDHDEAEVEGLVTDVTDWESAMRFSLNDRVVDASNAAFPDGQDGIVMGARVEVEGKIVNDVLVATKVELEDKHGNDDHHRIELHGVIQEVTGASTFTLRGIEVHYSVDGPNATVFQRGTASDLAKDKRVEVKGKLGSDGKTVKALVIRFES